MRRLAALLASLLASGCSDALANGDGRAFGDDLGRFHVKAAMSASTCGAGAMNAPTSWEFDVVLSKMPPTIYWNTGADAVEGSLERDGRTFTFSSETVVNTGAEATTGAASPTCAVVRDDDSSGALDSATSPKAFAGTLKYSFAPQGGSDCSALVLQGGADFAALPCSMAYRMSAAWVSAR